MLYVTLQIITRLRKSCHELGEEEIGKLAVSLFNCQSKAEGRALYYCSDEMVGCVGRCVFYSNSGISLGLKMGRNPKFL